MSTAHELSSATGASRARGHDDLAALARILAERFRGAPPRGYLRGKTRLRNALVQAGGLSALRAEALVDQMVARGFVRYTGDPRAIDDGTAEWLIVIHPLCVS